jgi:hypothetical protein
MKKLKIEDFINAPIYQGDKTDIKQAPVKYPVFNGALYYKCVSSKDAWLGIEAIIKLPEFIPDEERFEMITDPFGTYKRYMDTPSVYLGGSSDFETDIGFGFFRGFINGQISENKITFRPFWRTIFLEDGEEKNIYLSSNIYESEFYYYPGDTIKVHLVCLAPNQLTFRVELLEETKILPYAHYRKTHVNKLFIIDEIKAPGNGVNDTEYKRVNAIDQYRNEGKPTQKTKAQAINALWQDICLIRVINDELVKIPFTGNMEKKIFAPSEDRFIVKNEGTVESIDINTRNEE